MRRLINSLVSGSAVFGSTWQGWSGLSAGGGRGPLLPIVLLATLHAPCEPALAQDYQLGPSDRIRVRVIEWRSGQGEWVEWSAIGGEYSVSISGAVLLPFIGELSVLGQSPTRVAQTIATELQAKIGIPTRPDASVEIVQFRPVYVTGEVDRPGEFAYRPGLTVIQAISLAGGRYRLSDASLLRLERDWITSASSLEGARHERRRLLTRQARLDAELSERPTIDAPAELKEDPEAARLIADELAVMTSRRQALASALAGFRSLKVLYEREVGSLAQKIETQERQIAVARRELSAVTGLRSQGLAAAPRESSLERVIADLEGRLLDFQTAIIRARQEITKAERDAEDLVMRRAAEIASEMQLTQANLDQVNVRISAARALMNESSVTAPALMGDRLDRASAPLRFSILRVVEGRQVETPAEEMTALRPGDVVRVAAGTAGSVSDDRSGSPGGGGRTLIVPRPQFSSAGGAADSR